MKIKNYITKYVLFMIVTLITVICFGCSNGQSLIEKNRDEKQEQIDTLVEFVQTQGTPAKDGGKEDE